MKCWSSYIVEGELMEVINRIPNLAARPRVQLRRADIAPMWVLGEITMGEMERDAGC